MTTYTCRGVGYWPECRAQDDIEPWQNESNAHKVQSRYISSNSVFPVDIVTEWRFLGVIIDQYLSFNSHVAYVVQKAQKCYSILLRLKRMSVETEKLSHVLHCQYYLYFNILYAGHFYSFNQNTNWIPRKCAEIMRKNDFTQFQILSWVTKCFIFTSISSF